MIPLHSNDIAEITPPSLANLAVAPVFKFRPATKLDIREFGRQLRVEGLQWHDQEAVRKVILEELEALWSADVFAAEAEKLKAFWAAADQGVEVTAAEQRAYTEFMDRLSRASRRLRETMADCQSYLMDAPKIAFGMFCVGWRNLNAGFRLEGGIVPLELVYEVVGKLDEIEQQAVADKINGVGRGKSFDELASFAFDQFGLTATQAGNSAGPSS